MRHKNDNSDDDELSLRNTMQLEQESWLANHIIINKKFYDEARAFKIKPLSNEYWVYAKTRDYEEYGKFGFCVAGTERIAEDTGLTKRQVENSYAQLVVKGAIKHIWTDQKVYRSKTKVYMSAALIQLKGLQITEDNLVSGTERKIPHGKENLSIDLAGAPANLAGKSANLAGKSALNNTNNNTNNVIPTKMVGKQTVDGEPSNERKVLDFYNSTFDSNLRPLQERLRTIRTRLKTYTGEELCQAILNARKDPWFNGKNDRQWHGDIDYLMRNDKNVEKYLNYQPPKPRLYR